MYFKKFQVSFQNRTNSNFDYEYRIFCISEINLFPKEIQKWMAEINEKDIYDKKINDWFCYDNGEDIYNITYIYI